MNLLYLIIEVFGISEIIKDNVSGDNKDKDLYDYTRKIDTHNMCISELRAPECFSPGHLKEYKKWQDEVNALSDRI